MSNKRKAIRDAFIIVGIVTAVVSIAVITVELIPLAQALLKPEMRLRFQAYLDSLGFAGWIIILVLQVLRIVLAFIPGEPIELMSGLMFGALGGMIVCLIGIFIGSGIVFYLTKTYGHKFIRIFVSEKKLQEFKFIHDTKRLEIVTFVLFFLPGTPKDALTYIAGLTDIKPSRFMLISTFARIPSVVTSTIVGANISNGNYKLSLIIFLAVAVIGAIGLLVHKKLIK